MFRSSNTRDFYCVSDGTGLDFCSLGAGTVDLGIASLAILLLFHRPASKTPLPAWRVGYEPLSARTLRCANGLRAIRDDAGAYDLDTGLVGDTQAGADDKAGDAAFLDLLNSRTGYLGFGAIF